MLSPQSIAVVGASAKSRWSQMLMANLNRYGFDGRLSLVNPRGGESFGHAVVTSCREVEGPIDVALLLVPPHAVEAALRDAAAANAKSAVVLASGYAEAGAEGQVAQADLQRLSAELDLPFLGPNGLGFASLVDRRVGWLGHLPPRCRPGSVAIVSQSGNVATSLCGVAARLGIGISHVIATGNEAVVNLVDVMEYIVELDTVRAIGVFAEAIADPKLFLQVANRAAELAKPIVIIKAGRSDLGRRLAQTHTGAMAGNESIIDAAFRSSGVIRVDSLEQLITTAGLMARTGPLRAGGLGMVSVSGGTNDLLADRAEQVNVPLTPLGEEAAARIEREKPAGAVVQNPYDITGGAARNPQAWDSAITAMLNDPGYGLVAIGGFEQLSLPDDIEGERIDEERLGWITQAVNNEGASDRAVVLLNAVQDFSGHQVAALADLKVPHILAGIDHGVAAVAHAMTWSSWLRDRSSATVESDETTPVEPSQGIWSEAESLNLFSSLGVPTLPFEIAASGEEAVQAAERLGYPVVAKIASAQISHKTDIGGVQLDLRSREEVAAAFDKLIQAGELHAEATVDGVLIAPMQPEGLDLIVGALRDPQWGLLILIGLGGVHAEAMKVQATRLLPATRQDIVTMLEQLSVPSLLSGLRATEPPTMSQVVDAISAFARFASRAGTPLVSAEINPLRLASSRVAALDGLIEWA